MAKGGAKQSFARETNINNIMSKYHKTGQLPVVAASSFYGDFSSGADFQSAMNRVASVRSAFARLDPKIRDRFDNSLRTRKLKNACCLSRPKYFLKYITRQQKDACSSTALGIPIIIV